MRNKILNEKIVTDTARDTGVDLDVAKKVIKQYYSRLKNELTNGMEIRTPLGRLSVTKRNLNPNMSDKTFTHKLTYRIDKDYQYFLDTGVK